MVYIITYFSKDKENCDVFKFKDKLDEFICKFIETVHKTDIFLYNENYISNEFLSLISEDTEVLRTSSTGMVFNDLNIVFGKTLVNLKELQTILKKFNKDNVENTNLIKKMLPSFKKIEYVDTTFISIEEIEKLKETDIVLHIGDISKETEKEIIDKYKNINLFHIYDTKNNVFHKVNEEVSNNLIEKINVKNK